MLRTTSAPRTTPHNSPSLLLSVPRCPVRATSAGAFPFSSFPRHPMLASRMFISAEFYPALTLSFAAEYYSAFLILPPVPLYYIPPPYLQRKVSARSADLWLLYTGLKRDGLAIIRQWIRKRYGNG